MTGSRATNEASLRRSSTAVTLVICAAVVGIPYVCERAYRRWLKATNPLAELLASLERLGTSYRQKRSDMTELAEVAAIVLGEVARATSRPDPEAGRRPARP